jgi:ABC-type branched-subunit amino acid transport system ATPase component
MPQSSMPISVGRPVTDVAAVPALAARALTAGYGGPPAIEDVDFRAEAGRITALLGPNGAGKSTVLRTLTGVLRPHRGCVHLYGDDVTGRPPEELVRRGIAYVPQAANVFETLTVRENLEVGGSARASGLRDRLERMLVLFPDLRPALRRVAGTLSGGERSMLAVARGLMAGPSVLLLDEPCAGLSPSVRGDTWRHITAARAAGVAVVVVEQDARGALAHADWAWIMALGRIRLNGAGRDLLYDERVVDLYVGRTA